MTDRSFASSLVSSALALLILGGHATNAGSGNDATKAATPQETHNTYQLTAGAHIDVSNISGPVSVEAANGSIASVSIYRSAPNPDDLAYRKVSVDQTSSGLTIQQKPDGTETASINLLNRVVLTVPRKVSVRGHSISGDFNISGVHGAVDLSSISGSVDARHVIGDLAISGASGNVRVVAEAITDAGLQVSNVSGNVFLRLASNLNADLSVSKTSGAVSSGIAGLGFHKVGDSYSLRLGSGGPPIVVSNVTGAVALQSL
jgi:DUF4097 and DUF4098 domain-containing protein YvlB